MSAWPVIGGVAARGELLVDAAAVVLRLRALLVLAALSVVGWGLECVGYWLILGGFGLDASLPLCAFLWSVGTLVGAFIMGLLSNGSDLLGISPYLQQAIIGAVIILAVAADELRKRKLT